MEAWKGWMWSIDLDKYWHNNDEMLEMSSRTNHVGLEFQVLCTWLQRTVENGAHLCHHTARFSWWVKRKDLKSHQENLRLLNWSSCQLLFFFKWFIKTNILVVALYFCFQFSQPFGKNTWFFSTTNFQFSQPFLKYLIYISTNTLSNIEKYNLLKSISWTKEWDHFQVIFAPIKTSLVRKMGTKTTEVLDRSRIIALRASINMVEILMGGTQADLNRSKITPIMTPTLISVEGTTLNRVRPMAQALIQARIQAMVQTIIQAMVQIQISIRKWNRPSNKNWSRIWTILSESLWWLWVQLNLSIMRLFRKRTSILPRNSELTTASTTLTRASVS